jgi:hypothetical protein
MANPRTLVIDDCETRYDTLTLRRTLTVEVDTNQFTALEVTLDIRLPALLQDLVTKALTTATSHSKLHDGDIDLGIVVSPTLHAIRQHRKRLKIWVSGYRSVSFDARSRVRKDQGGTGFYSPEADVAAAAAELAWISDHPRPVLVLPTTTKGA